MNEKNKEVRIVNNKYAIPAAVTQYNPRRMRTSEILTPIWGIKAVVMYEIGKVARNIAMSVRIFLRCIPAQDSLSWTMYKLIEIDAKKTYIVHGCRKITGDQPRHFEAAFFLEQLYIFQRL